jgi:threonine aldolase
MRDAIAGAPVGDDQLGEGPSVNGAQARVAELLGQAAAWWRPSVTFVERAAELILKVVAAG